MILVILYSRVCPVSRELLEKYPDASGYAALVSIDSDPIKRLLLSKNIHNCPTLLCINSETKKMSACHGLLNISKVLDAVVKAQPKESNWEKLKEYGDDDTEEENIETPKTTKDIMGLKSKGMSAKEIANLMLAQNEERQQKQENDRKARAMSESSAIAPK